MGQPPRSNLDLMLIGPDGRRVAMCIYVHVERVFIWRYVAAARWLVPGEHRGAPFSKGVSDDTETGEQERAEICLWHSVQLRAYRTP